MIRKKNIPKNIWGPKLWYMLHVNAINYNDYTISPYQKFMEYKKLEIIFSNIPCQECSTHALAYYYKNPPSLDNNESYQFWMFNFHNNVNNRLGKKTIIWKEYINMYIDERNSPKLYWQAI